MKKLTWLFILFYSTFAYADLGPTRTDTGKVELSPDKLFKLEGDLSYLLNSSKSNGQTSSKENLAAHVLFQRQVGIWGQELQAEAVSANDDGNSGNNVERYMIAAKVLHRSSDTIYQYAKLQADKDLQSAFDYQIALTAGLGFDLLKDENQTLTTEVGAGYRYSKDRYAPFDDQNEVIGTLGLYYEYLFNERVKFNQDLGYEFGEEAQVLRSRSTISASLSEAISGIVSYQIKDTQADSGNSRDSLLSVGIKYTH